MHGWSSNLLTTILQSIILVTTTQWLPTFLSCGTKFQSKYLALHQYLDTNSDLLFKRFLGFRKFMVLKLSSKHNLDMQFLIVTISVQLFSSDFPCYRKIYFDSILLFAYHLFFNKVLWLLYNFFRDGICRPYIYIYIYIYSHMESYDCL